MHMWTNRSRRGQGYLQAKVPFPGICILFWSHKRPQHYDDSTDDQRHDGSIQRGAQILGSPDGELQRLPNRLEVTSLTHLHTCVCRI